MQTMAVAWNGTTLNDKVKLLSVTELGGGSGTPGSAFLSEGNPYYTYLHNKKVTWWLRTRATDSNNNVWDIDKNSSFGGSGFVYNTPNGLSPCIRLG